MHKSGRKITLFFLFLGDILLLYAALFLVLKLRYAYIPNEGMPWRQHILPFSIIFVFWVIFFGSFGLYELRFLKNSRHFLYRLMRAMVANAILAIMVFYLLPFFEIEPRRNLFLIATISIIFIFFWRHLYNYLIIKTPPLKVLFFGVNRDTEELADWLMKNPQHGYKPVALMAHNGETLFSASSLPLFSAYKDLVHIIKDYSIDTIIISREIKENKTLVSLLFQVIPFGIGVVEFPTFYEMNIGKIPLSLIGEVWFLENLIGAKKFFYEYFKRGFDILLAAVLIVPSAFLFLIIAPAIKLDSHGPVFFRQKRVGKGIKTFTLIKYRSMVNNAESLGGLKGEEKDVRHTKVGAFLRKTYLDEVPQIINILRGEMSFIGPRPERPEYIKELREKIPFYEMRLLVPPGITGWAQINMENDASVEDAPEKMQYDLYYIKNRSFVLDFIIAIRTLFTLIRRQGR